MAGMQSLPDVSKNRGVVPFPADKTNTDSPKITLWRYVRTTGMRRDRACLLSLLLGAVAVLPSCLSRGPVRQFEPDLEDYRKVATEIEYPLDAPSSGDDVIGPAPPRAIRDSGDIAY